jgi:hypothetical protein
MTKGNGASVTILIALLMTGMFVVIVSYQATPATPPLTIDGQITGTEWDARAWETAHYGVFWTYQTSGLPRNLQTYCYLYLHADATYLYICADLCGDITNDTTYEWFGICIDCWNDDLTYIYDDNFNETNERLFWDVSDNELIVEEDYNDHCSSTLDISDFDLAWSFSASPNFAIPHRIFEVRILLESLSYTTWNHSVSGHTSIGDTIGVLVMGYGTMATNNILYTIPMQGIAWGGQYSDWYETYLWAWMNEYNYINWQVSTNGLGTTNCNTTVLNEIP